LLLEHRRAEDPRTKALIPQRKGALRVSKLSPISPFLVSTRFFKRSRLMVTWTVRFSHRRFDD
jgi:hypothetical protein